MARFCIDKAERGGIIAGVPRLSCATILSGFVGRVVGIKGVKLIDVKCEDSSCMCVDDSGGEIKWMVSYESESDPGEMELCKRRCTIRDCS